MTPDKRVRLRVIACVNAGVEARRGSQCLAVQITESLHSIQRYRCVPAAAYLLLKPSRGITRMIASQRLGMKQQFTSAHRLKLEDVQMESESGTE